MTEYDIGNIIADISDVPQSWIYKHYYAKFKNGELIKQPFDGRIIRAKSVVNRDSNPSLFFYYKNSHYFWKDFSSGIGGNAMKFVAYHMNKADSVVGNMIMREYEKYLTEGNIESEEPIIFDEIKKSEFKVVSDFYNEHSLSFWEMHKIDINCLNLFKMRRGIEYHIYKGTEHYSFGGFFFAFYNSKGPYQIYQPHNEKAKYINIDTSYLIGSEQLKFKSDTCIIISGLKDIAAINMIGLNCEYVAGSSETTLISKDNIDFLRSKYKFVLSMLDNDPAGLRAMQTYKKVYKIPYIHVKFRKDLAENNIHYPIEKLKYSYTELIHKKINE